MIGIVVVSHSHALGMAAVVLATEMVDTDRGPHIEVASGLDDQTLGTDAAAVAAAIGRADEASAGAGVLVLLDLGSAVLSAEMALEFLDADVAGRTRLSSGPMVEGLVAAVVTAAGGADLDTVAAEALRGLDAKKAQVADAGEVESTADSEPAELTGSADELRLEVSVDIPHGLHARPAARLVGCVNQHGEARVRLSNLTTGKGPVQARSLSAVATLGVLQGHRIEFRAGGVEARAALDEIEALAATGFGDRQEVAPAPRVSRRTMGQGLGAAIGPAIRRRAAPDLTTYRSTEDPEAELDRLTQALASARADLASLVSLTQEPAGQEAAIFEAHLALLEDPSLVEVTRSRIRQGEPAATSWHQQADGVAAEFAALSDAYQRDRAQDVRSVMHRVERALLQLPEEDGEGVGILVVDELDPATATLLEPDRIQGVVALAGGATGHGALIAKARGVPVLTGAGARAEVADGTIIAFDERAGRLLVDPDADQRSGIERLLTERRQARSTALSRAQEPAITRDGHVVAVMANVSDHGEAEAAVRQGAEGAGLVRTEVLFEGWDRAPTVQEQVEAFASLAQAMEGRPLTIRTWDIGADKPMPFVPMQPEANPFLGMRGLRSFRADPAVLLDQLEAVCRLARGHRVRVMFPMVSTVEEVDWALARLAEAASRGGAERPDGLEVGIMVEVPAAALRAEALTVHLDFVSIGTNDLTQYVLAAERGNAAVDVLADPCDPAVLRLVQMVCDDVAEGVQVGVCGAAASDPDLARLLVGLGVDELSATASTVPEVKMALRESSLVDLEDLAERALRCHSAAEVRRLMGH